MVANGLFLVPGFWSLPFGATQSSAAVKQAQEAVNVRQAVRQRRPEGEWWFIVVGSWDWVATTLPLAAAKRKSYLPVRKGDKWRAVLRGPGMLLVALPPETGNGKRGSR